tara:strand:- start:107 stop:790 length:684 start_codon:yes stop_codon:yes gene_type:complete
MCGRIAFFKSKKKVINELQIDKWDEYQYSSDYNIVPSNKLYVLTSKKSLRVIESMTWGIRPRRLEKKRLINVRIETLQQKPSFRNLLNTSRCLIICNGYYEWKKERVGSQPYYIFRKSKKLILLAGLWTASNLNSEQSFNSCTIITKPSQHNISEIHQRMPLILHLSNVDTWLNSKDKIYFNTISDLSYSNIDLEYHPVSKAINDPFNNNPELLNPIEIKRTMNLFP